MKKLLNIILALGTLLVALPLIAQEEEKPELSLNLRYFNRNGSLQYMKIKAMIRENKKLQPVSEANIQVFLNETSAENLIAKIKTDENGEAKFTIPVSMKEQWNASLTHHFIAVAEATKKYPEATSELEVVKAKILIDTLYEEGVRKVAAKVLFFDSSGWLPATDAEIRIGVSRLGGELKIGEEEIYTTDSLGQAVGEFQLDSLPTADIKNNITLVVKTEDHEQFGNLYFEKPVPWGQYKKPHSEFNQRSLWASRDKSPIWLLFMAGSIVLGVWTVLFYLIFQLIKIRKLGKVNGKKNPEFIGDPKMIHAE